MECDNVYARQYLRRDVCGELSLEDGAGMENAEDILSGRGDTGGGIDRAVSVSVGDL